MRITWFGHSAFKIEFGKTSILFDPFLTGSDFVGRYDSRHLVPGRLRVPGARGNAYIEQGREREHREHEALYDGLAIADRRPGMVSGCDGSDESRQRLDVAGGD